MKNQRDQTSKIYLVEDDEEAQKKFLQLADQNGWEVSICIGSLEAIKRIKNEVIPNLLIINKDAKPLDAFQTYDYIQSELNVNINVMMSCDPNLSFEDPNDMPFTIINKPFSDYTAEIINSILQEQSSQITTKAQVYSLNYLKNLSDGDLEFITTSVNMFTESVGLKLEEIMSCLIQKDFKEIREIAHNIKPSFEMLESTDGSNLCNDIAHKAQDAEIRVLVTKLQDVFSAMDFQLNKDFSKFAEA